MIVDIGNFSLIFLETGFPSRIVADILISYLLILFAEKFFSNLMNSS